MRQLTLQARNFKVLLFLILAIYVFVIYVSRMIPCSVESAIKKTLSLFLKGVFAIVHKGLEFLKVPRSQYSQSLRTLPTPRTPPSSWPHTNIKGAITDLLCFQRPWYILPKRPCRLYSCPVSLADSRPLVCKNSSYSCLSRQQVLRLIFDHLHFYQLME